MLWKKQLHAHQKVTSNCRLKYKNKNRVKTGLLLTCLRQTDTQAMIAKGPENLKLCHSYLFTSDMRIRRTFLKLAAGEVIPLTAAMQTFGAQWGETDKVTYIQLRSRLHVIFSGYKCNFWLEIHKQFKM